MAKTQSSISLKNACLAIAGGVTLGVLFDQILGHPPTAYRQIIIVIAVLFFALSLIFPKDIRSTMQSWSA